MSSWTQVADRIADGVDFAPGSFVVLRDRCGRSEVLDAVVIAFERRGITTVIDPADDTVLDAVLSGTDPALLATWGRHRSAVLELADAVVSLGAGPVPVERAPDAALAALRAGRAEMEQVESRRSLPFLVVAIATPRLAEQLGQPMEQLDRIVRQALGASRDETMTLIEDHLRRSTADPIVLETEGCSLRLERGDRPWLHDDGHISADDVARGAVTSNLPCGSIYTTVLENTATGTLRVPELAGARDVVLTFTDGVVTAADRPQVLPWLAQFGPDAGRISHLGIGLNPRCDGGTGWTIVDEHRAGAVFVALGENRYMGGTNASELNHDIALDAATLRCGDQTLVSRGRLAAWG